MQSPPLCTLQGTTPSFSLAATASSLPSATAALRFGSARPSRAATSPPSPSAPTTLPLLATTLPAR
eukprot:3175924-Pleurochrysis_carterae.AAC.1